MEKDEEAKKSILIDPNKPIIFSDHLSVFSRVDGLHTLAWCQEIPFNNQLSEVVKIIVTKNHLKKVIDVLCDNADYYPKKKVSKKKS